MKNNLTRKIKVLLKARQIFQNWTLYLRVYLKMVTDEHVIFQTKKGLKIKIRSNSTDLMALTNVWLYEEYASKNYKINDEDIIIDIGSHIGLFALYASQFCKNGKIYCFEPVKENYDMLISNLKLNNITNVYPNNLAVSKTSDKVKIFLNEDEAGHSMFIENAEHIEISSIRLKEIFENNKIEKCDLLKLDCEGVEYEIIDTLPESIANKILNIILEYHFANSKQELLHNLMKKLEKLLFKITKKESTQEMGMIYAHK